MEEDKIQQQPKPKDKFKAWDDPLFADLRRMFSRAKLREVLTHSSYYEQEGKDAGKGNSRYVFAGMYVFKGMVADVLFRYYTGEGTRLQHILGNLFRQERLEQLFDEWQLRQFARAGKSFDVVRHKHIFVHAIMGYVSTLDENTRNWFISKYIINKETAHLLGHKKRNSDLLAQADDIVRQTDGRRLTLEMEVTDEGLNKAKAVLSDGTVLCESVSKSWRYARKKVTKLALDILAMPSRKYFLSNPDYQARVLKRKEEEQAQRKAEVEEREAQKKAAREKRKEDWKIERRAQDAKRRANQAAKKSKTENATRATKNTTKAHPMSTKKK